MLPGTRNGQLWVGGKARFVVCVMRGEFVVVAKKVEKFREKIF